MASSSSCATARDAKRLLTRLCASQQQQQQNSPNKRRFAQAAVVAHPSVVAVTTGANNNDEGDKKNKNKKDQSLSLSKGKTTKQKQKTTTLSSTKRRRRQTTPARSTKSIEDLEARMMKRWSGGTTMANPNDYELVDNDDTYNEKKKDYHPNVDKHKHTSQPRVFHSKPVLDPWEEERHQTRTNAKEKDKQLRKRQTESSDDDYDDNNNVMMKRVRNNQQRLLREQQQQHGHSNKTNYKIGMYYNTNNNNDDDEDSYYNNNDMPNALSSLECDDKDDRNNKIDDNDDDSSPGFFFQHVNVISHDNDKRKKNDVGIEDQQQQRTKQKQSKRHPKNRSVPVLDDDGNPIFLTLKRAQRDFEMASLERRRLTEQQEDDNVVISTTELTTGREPKLWSGLGISSEILVQNLRDMNCGMPLPVQDKACPSVVTGQDVLIGTYTGSGKTLACLVPLAQRLLNFNPKSNGVQVLIVAPGRELASQIVSVARQLLVGTDIVAMLAIGGTTFSRNLEQIRKRRPSILVGTPGRIAELVVGTSSDKSGRLKVHDVQTLVLDEFDALLEYKPHRDPTRAIIASLKKRHGDSLQTILCSATASDMIGTQQLGPILRPDFAQAMADRNDQLVTSVGDVADVTRVSSTTIHGVIHVPHRRLALETLRRILYTEPTPQQVLVFVDNARRVDIVIEKLLRMGIVAAPLHGGYGSEKVDRAEVSKALREGYVGIVVATELAARGLDAPLLTHCINLDLPTDASHYAHRAGRCGRGGRPGVVINITTQPKERNVPQRFADSLGITMHNVEARAGKLFIVEPASVDLD